MPDFRFKQFTICQSRSPFKVGTDSVLLGAWISPGNGPLILDAGTGTGLLALMMAQRFSSAQVHAVEIQEEALHDAESNFRNSPWNERLTLHAGDLMEFSLAEKFDLIISNPPYFADDLNSPQKGKSISRHQQSFTYAQFFGKCISLVQGTGKIACIFPSRYWPEIQGILASTNLWVSRHCRIRSYAHSPFIREMIECSPLSVKSTETEILDIYVSEKNYSEKYRELTRDFYLNF